jgi:hypothetical protein
MRTTILVIIAWLALAGAAQGHPSNKPKTPEQAAVEQEVIAFRKALVEAITAKDAAKLAALYHDSFTHTHGSGKMDPKDTRIVSVLKGDPVIEDAPADELSVRVIAPTAAIVTGKSPIRSLADGKTYDFRWIAVYAKGPTGWQLAASQATRLPLPQ